jgi:hypothetical protein
MSAKTHRSLNYLKSKRTDRLGFIYPVFPPAGLFAAFTAAFDPQHFRINDLTSIFAGASFSLGFFHVAFSLFWIRMIHRCLLKYKDHGPAGKPRRE